jgi:DNA repair protein RecO (recombination protein O)
VTGQHNDLIYVSPKSGAAVSRAGAGDWADRLLPYPPCLRDGPGTKAEVLLGLRTTGHFLERHLAPALGDKPIPAARGRLVETLERHG